MSSVLSPRPIARALLGALVLALALGCDDDPASPAPVPEGFGTMQGVWDGKEWKGLGYAVLGPDDTLRVIGHRPDQQYHYDEYVRVSVLYLGKGTYAVAAKQGELAKLVGGDAGWFPDSPGELRVTGVTEVNSVSDAPPAVTRVRGVVQLESADSHLPWQFAGVFDVPVYARWEDVPRSPVQRAP